MRVTVFALTMVLSATGQGRLDEAARTVLLARVIATMRQALARMSDYTCTESIARSTSEGSLVRVRTLERIRLQVAMIGGKEVFSWPGAAPFELDNPYEIVGGGLAGTGDFAGFSRAVFGNDAAEFTTGEEEVWRGKRTIRYDYVVPRKASGYVLRSGTESAVVDYGGSFWVDLSSQRVLTMRVEVDYRRNRIPEAVDMFDVNTLLEFQYQRIGDEELPFPANSTLSVMHLRNSVITSNRIEFSACRQYAATSSIQFGEQRAAVATATPAPLPAELPDNLLVEVELENAISADSSAAGDAVQALVVRAAKDGGWRIPKGARLSGRILRVETDVEADTTHVQLGFSNLEFEGRSYPFHARFVTFRSAPGVTGGGPRSSKWLTLRDIRNAGMPEWSTRTDFTLSGKEGRLPKGFRMQWSTDSQFKR